MKGGMVHIYTYCKRLGGSVRIGERDCLELEQRKAAVIAPRCATTPTA